MTKRVRLLVGTKKGAFILESDETRADWSVRGPMCEGWPVHDLIVEPGSGAILAAAGNAWYGPAVWRSPRTAATTWTHSSAGMTYGDDAEPITTIWSLGDDARRRRSSPASSRPGSSGATTSGATWRHVEGLTNHPTPADMGPGRRRADPAHDHPPPDRPRPDLGRDLGRRRVRDARRRRRRGSRGTSASGPSSTPRTASPRPGSASTSSRWPRASRTRSTSATTTGSTARTMARRRGRRSPAACRPTSGSRWSPIRATPTRAG